ncbi:hypothetical protein [Frankia tisae]|uniref:hypothetical protein n=1 Tax=Frankia tisae TaxID=2950104 RepID=UPI0021C018E2|nr:hypothetical protein [Frankia tisae]
MIDDGPLFKQGLCRAVESFERDMKISPWWPRLARVDQDGYCRWRFEETVFRFALGVRKLIEAAKISIEVQAVNIEVGWAPLRGKSYPDTLTYDRIDRLYDLDRIQERTISLVNFCNSVIHSFTLVAGVDVGRFKRVYMRDFFFASDRQRREGVLHMTWQTFRQCVVLPVVADELITTRWFRTGDGKELRIPSSRGDDFDLEEAVELYMNLSTGNKKAVERFIAAFRAEYGASPF